MNPGFTFRQPVSPRRLSLTPLVDVVFILLLFFMLASRFEDWQAMALDTAQEAGSNADNDQPVAGLLITTEGDLVLNESPVSPGELAALLQQRLEESPAITVLITPAEGVKVQFLMQIVDRVRDAGIRSLQVGDPVTRP